MNAAGPALPRSLVATVISLGLHLTALAWWVAFHYAEAALTPPSTQTRRAAAPIVAELVTRVAAPAVPPAPAQAPEATEPPPPAPPQVASRAGGGRDSYFARLREHLGAHRRPVAGAEGMRVSQVRVHLAGDGSVGRVRLMVSSGSEALDAEALALISRAAPMPPPPQAMTVVVPVEFR